MHTGAEQAVGKGSAELRRNMQDAIRFGNNRQLCSQALVNNPPALFEL